MREIKFRIWNPSGNNILYDIDNVFKCLEQQISFDKTMPNRGFIVPYNHKGDGMVWMQFTGLKDKNGIEIYEGDIISMYTKKPVAIVEFDYCSFVLKWIDKVYKNTRQKEKEPIFRNIHLFEVIGNIYENPELLATI